MDPRNFLTFAENLCNSAICDVETDARVGADRCYYAVTHATYQSILRYVESSGSQDAKRDVIGMRREIHRLVLDVLEDIKSKFENQVYSLQKTRKKATYEIHKDFPTTILNDAITIAREIFTNLSNLSDELDAAYESEIIDDLYWSDLKGKIMG